MIDLDDMEKFSQSIIERGIGHTETGASCYEAIELITRLRQAEKDAARYRWLRDTGCFEGSNDDFFHATPAQTDSAIDEAMQCK